jgi:AcrR family transcriptional regulator
MRRTKEEAARTREHLLDAALLCFRTRGYSATTLDDIARQAETTRGAIHWHFGNKAELFNTLVRERYERAATIFREVYALGGSSLQQFRHLLMRWLTYAEEDSDFRTVLELLLLKTEAAPELAGGMQEKIRGQRFSLEYFAGLIRKGMAEGEIRAEINPEIAALAALGMINGVTSIWLMDPLAFSLKSIAQEAVDLFLQGIVKA